MRTVRFWTTFLLLGCLCLEQWVMAGDVADQIKKASGIERGLCVVVGCGGKKTDAALVAKLAVSGKILTHGLALDDAGLNRANKAVTALKVEGLAVIEKVPINPLPYRDNLVNLLIVEDIKTAAAAGFSNEEVMRVLAPMGKLCVLNNGKWEVTAKQMPKEMDEWPQEDHGADGNRVSNDKIFKFPVGYRWNADLPFNISSPKQSANSWSSTRAMVLSDGKCYALSSSVLENLSPAFFLEHGLDQYITARDAFNGLFLWRKKVGPTFYGGLYYLNRAPLAAFGNKVYAVFGDGKLVALDGNTGETVKTFDTTYPAGRLLVDQGILVAATWKDGTCVGGLTGVDRRRMDYAVSAGTVEAFDVANGKRLWKIDKLATSMRDFGGVLYMAQREGPDLKEDIGLNPYRKKEDQSPIPSRPKQAIVAVDLKTGNQRWAVPSDSFGAEEYLRVDVAGPGVVVVFQDSGKESFILSEKDGKIMSKTALGHATFFEGGLQLAGQKYDISTCKVSGKPAFSLGKAFCTPSCYVNGMTISNRGGGGYRALTKSEKYMGLRGACLLGSIPAYGEMFTAQNWCSCVPSQIQGLIAVGPVSSEPTPDEMEKAPVLEKGPEYQNVKGGNTGVGIEEWPMYRKDAARRNSTTTTAPSSLELLWKTAVASSVPGGPVAFNWKENLNSPLTAPVVAGGFVVAAVTDRDQVVALDVLTGKEKWRVTVSGKIDTPPTICEGHCIFGSCDGYIYAFTLKNGKLAWRMRAAPREERMVSYGKVESPWPVIGSLLADNGLVYASAGRSLGSDGGVVVRAVEPVTGSVRWSKALTRVEGRQLKLNDIPVKVENAIQVATLRLDPATGEFKDSPTEDYLKYIKTKNDLITKKQDTSALKEPEKKEVAFLVGNDGLISWNWTRLGNRKYQNIKLGNFHSQGVQLSWNDKIACALTDLGRGLSVIPCEKIQPAGYPANSKDILWSARLPEGYQATSVIICGNAIVVGGGIYAANSSAPKGFIQMYPLDKGQKIAEQVFDSPLAYNGLAMANGNIYAASDDGSLACVGKKK